MPITTLTAYIIASRDDIIVTSGGPAANGKYVGWITLGPDDRCRPLLNSEPIYDTPQEAEDAMRQTVEDLRRRVLEEENRDAPQADP